MTAVRRSTVVGIFEDAKMAEKAVTELGRAGFPTDRIGVAVRQPKVVEENIPPPHETKAEEGGLTGVLAGGLLGGLLGAGAIALGVIPGVGPILGVGLLAAVTGGVTAGAVAGGLVGALVGMGIPEEEAHYYHDQIQAGRTIVTVQADDRHDEAVAILRRCGALGKGGPLI
jgi:hypothetical protein